MKLGEAVHDRNWPPRGRGKVTGAVAILSVTAPPTIWARTLLHQFTNGVDGLNAGGAMTLGEDGGL
jgi:hypothetical protein